MGQEDSLSDTTPYPIVNSLVEGLPEQSRDRVLRRSIPVELAFGEILCERGKPFPYVYFPLSGGFISLVATGSGHPPLEMGMIGDEGMLGVSIVLGVSEAPLRGLVQGAGSALRMTAADFRRELRQNPALVTVLHRYLYVLTAQLSQTAVCTRFHDISQRLARWLLMTHDRAHADSFYLTHAFLSWMLGVQRSAITIAAGQLQKRKIVSYSRGHIRILNRGGLEASACECYPAIIEEYAHLLN